MKLRSTLIALALAAMAVLTGCGKKAIEKAEAQANGNRAPERVEVAIAPVIERAAARGIEVVGSLEAEDDVTVSSQASGNLDEITIDVGSQVRRGQTIGRIDQGARELTLRTLGRVERVEDFNNIIIANVGSAPVARP
jgi:multidrug efflux pump subunit AcrA (membrane-fusion protein)